MTTRTLRVAFLVVFGVLLAIQLVPYRVSNPAVRQEPAWINDETRALIVRACFDCHSNETQVPWYGKVAPISWWTTNHVKEGRSALNFSEWDRPQRRDELAEVVEEGSMPPGYYTWLGEHPGAKLSPAERDAVIAQLRALESGSGDTGRG